MRRNGLSISATELSDALRLQVAIDHTMSERGCGAADSAPLVALRRAGGLRPLMVAVLASNCEQVEDENVAAILYVFNPNEDVRPLLQAACKLYGLSPVETKLACLLTCGASLGEAAKDMRVKEQTARTYLKQVFLKTDTNRQAELVRVMLASLVRTAQGANLQIV